jgi:hypothetical protein
MQKIATLGAIAALGMSGAALAAEGPSYSYVEAGYGITDLQSPGAIANGDANGFVVGASLDLPANLIAFASYGDRGYDIDGSGEIDQTDISIGLGYKWSISDSFDVITGASFERLKLDGGGDSVKESGFGLRLGMRSFVTEKFELNTLVRYTDMQLDDLGGASISGFAISTGGRYYFTPNFAGGLDVTSDKIYAGISQIGFLASLRYDFGKQF